MSCERYEAKIALLVSGDLPDRKARKVQRHIDGCNACRRLETQLRDDRESLHALRDSITEVDLRSELRERVLRAITRPENRRMHDSSGRAADLMDSASNSRRGRSRITFGLACAGLTAVIVGVAAIGWSARETETRVDRPVQTAMVPSADQKRLDAKNGRTPESHISSARISETLDPAIQASVSSAHQSKPSVTVRLYTNDPRVVIFLVSDQTGG